MKLGLDCRKQLGPLDGCLNGSTGDKFEGLLIGDSLGSTYGKVISSDEGTARAGLTWSRLHVVVVGWMFGGVGFHATSKGAELSCDIDCTI